MNTKKHADSGFFCAALLLGISALLAVGQAQAQTHSASGFLTMSYSLSDDSNRYLRNIDNKGTFRNGSIVGLQIDSKFSETISTTVQIAAFESDRKDNSTRVDFKWANINYRPGNQWLMRAGKLRNSLVLDAQNLDIGATYTPARLPPEVYFSTNLLEYYGGSVARYFELSRRTEMSVEAFVGRTDTNIRLISLPKTPSSQIRFVNAPLDLAGANVRLDSGPYSAQVNLSRYRGDDPAFSLAVNTRSIGLRGPVGPVMGRLEYFHADYPRAAGKPAVNSGAVIIEKTFAKYTPYISLAYSDYMEVGSGKNNAAGIGLAYDVARLSKLKGEISRIRTGSDSFLFDSIPADREIKVLTLSYSQIF